MNKKAMTDFIEEIYNAGEVVENLVKKIELMEKKVEDLQQQVSALNNEKQGIEEIIQLSRTNQEQNGKLNEQEKQLEELKLQKDNLQSNLDKEKKQREELTIKNESQKETIEQLSKQMEEFQEKNEKNRKILGSILGNYKESYENSMKLYEKMKEEPWSNDASIKLFSSEDYMIFFSKCSNKNTIQYFYKKIKTLLDDIEYVKFIDELLDFCVEACSKTNGITYSRQKIETGEEYNLNIHQRIEGPVKGTISQIVLRGIVEDNEVLDKCGSYVKVEGE